jgi:hypothetical protein
MLWPGKNLSHCKGKEREEHTSSEQEGIIDVGRAGGDNRSLQYQDAVPEDMASEF